MLYRGAIERFAMYDRHKTVIKWYEYDATKLYRTEEADDVTEEVEEEAAVPKADDEKPESVTGDPEMDEEVARIMAAFSGAKQNSVDDVFAAMAAEADDTPKEDPDSLVARICAPKQNGVDDLVMMAREA